MKNIKKFISIFVCTILIFTITNVKADAGSIENVVPDINLRSFLAHQLGYESGEELLISDLDNISSLIVSEETPSFFEIKDFTGLEKLPNHVDALFIFGLSQNYTDKLIKMDLELLANAKTFNYLYMASNIFNDGIDFSIFSILLNKEIQSAIDFRDNILLINNDVELKNRNELVFTTKDWNIKFPSGRIFEYETNGDVPLYGSLNTYYELFLQSLSGNTILYEYIEDSHIEYDYPESNTEHPSNEYRFKFIESSILNEEDFLTEHFNAYNDDFIVPLSFGNGTTIFDSNVKFTFDNTILFFDIDFKHTSEVEIHYVDEDNNGIESTEILSGNYGESFEVKVKDIPGYTYIETKENNATRKNNTFLLEDRIFNVVYSKDKQKQSKAIIHYIDEDFNTLFEDVEFIGNVGDSFTIEIPKKEGYTFKTVLSNDIEIKNLDFNLLEDVLEFTVIYSKDKQKQSKAIVHYIDEDFNTLFEDVEFTGNVGDSFTIEIPKKEGYTFKTVLSNDIEIKNLDFNLLEDVLEFTVIYSKNNIEEPTVPEEELPETGITSYSSLAFILMGIGFAALSLNKLKKRYESK